MLYINDVQINLTEAKNYKGKDPLLLMLKAKIAEVNRHPSKELVFKYRKGLTKRNKHQGLMEGKKILVRMREHINSERGDEHWACTRRYNKNPNTGKVKISDLHLQMDQSWTLHRENDLDKILYLMCAAVKCQGPNPSILLENIESEAEDQFNQGLEAAEMKLKIRDMDVSMLQKLAMALGIPNPKDISEVVLRRDVFNAIEFKVTKKEKSWEDFFDMHEFKKNITILANIQEGLDRRVIGFSERVKGYWWLGDNESLDEELLAISPGLYGRRADVLAEYLNQGGHDYGKLMDRIKAARTGTRIMGGGDTIIDTDDKPTETVKDDEQFEDAVFATPEGEMNLKQIKAFVGENNELPFNVGDQIMNKIANEIKIQTAMGQRKRIDVFAEILAYFKA